MKKLLGILVLGLLLSGNAYAESFTTIEKLLIKCADRNVKILKNLSADEYKKYAKKPMSEKIFEELPWNSKLAEKLDYFGYLKICEEERNEAPHAFDILLKTLE